MNMTYKKHVSGKRGHRIAVGFTSDVFDFIAEQALNNDHSLSRQVVSYVKKCKNEYENGTRFMGYG